MQHTLIQKATDPSTGLDTPGYVYEELIQLTYQGNVAESLASCLVSHLAKASYNRTEKPLKVLKSLNILSRKGSRNFRRALRNANNDEHLRAAARRGNSNASQFASPSGTNNEDKIRTLAMV